jgi:O-acetyl-ADP-ribose deacetylase (regulator of RNase III)
VPCDKAVMDVPARNTRAASRAKGVVQNCPPVRPQAKPTFKVTASVTPESGATRSAAHALAGEFARLRHDTGNEQPTPAQIRAASAERARSIRHANVVQSPNRAVDPRVEDNARRQLLAEFEARPLTSKDATTQSKGRAEGSKTQSATLYGRYEDTCVELVVGDIADQTAQAVVSAANGDLKPVGGVAAALSRRGGALYDRICKMAIRERGRPVPATNCCVTGGGELPARNVIHAVGVRAEECSDADSMYSDTMRTVFNALDTAVTLGLRELALPAIGAGAFNIPLPIAAQAAAEALLCMTSDNLPTGVPGLRLVRWVLPDVKTQHVFATAFTRAGIEMKDKPSKPSRKLMKPHKARYMDDLSTDGSNGDTDSSEVSEVSELSEDGDRAPVQSASEGTEAEEPLGWQITRTPVKVAPSLTATDTEAGSEIDRVGEGSDGESLFGGSHSRATLRAHSVSKALRPSHTLKEEASKMTESDRDELTSGRVRFRAPALKLTNKTREQEEEVSLPRSILRTTPSKSGRRKQITDPVTGSEEEAPARGRAHTKATRTSCLPKRQPHSKVEKVRRHKDSTDTDGASAVSADEAELASGKAGDVKGRDKLAKGHEPIRHDNRKPRPYDGDYYVEQYLTQFRYTAKLAGWPAKEWGLQLASALEKEARRVLRMDHKDASGRPSYHKLCARLRETFGPRGTEELWRQKAEHYQKGRKETLGKMAENIGEYTEKAFPNMSEQDREAVTVGNFIRALPSTALRTDVRKSRPKSMAEALELALFFEGVDQVEDRREQQASVYHAATDRGGSKGSKKSKGKGKVPKSSHWCEDDAYDGDNDAYEEPAEEGDGVMLAQLAHEIRQLTTEVKRFPAKQKDQKPSAPAMESAE